MANFNIDYLVVGGGGGGASGYGGIDGGSGGAGGLITSWPGGSGGGSASGSPSTITFGTPYTVTVGDGGSGAAYAPPYMGILADSGDSSVFNNITALGGGGSRSWGNSAFQSSVSSGSPTYASGGGGTYTGPASGSVSAGSGTSTSRGYSGSNGQQTLYYGGAGGGAGGPAGSGTLKTSGPGMNVSITGATISYAGGGGNPLSSPNGGGGLARTSSGTGGFGTPNTGGGGGGAYGNGPTGGSGGSGVVILRYTTNTIDSYTTTGITPTEDTTTVPGQTILSFTTVGTGTITFTALTPPFSGTKVTTPVTDFNKPNTEEGLKIPSGTSSNQPNGVDGMVRNDTTQSSKGSASAITYYNGTDWRYFENELNTSFNTVIYTGSTSPHAITGVGFAPDLIWIKNRDQSDSYAIVDSVRGITSPAPYIASDSIATQATSTNMPTSVQSDGFTITGNGGRTNTSGEDYVAWCFKAGGLINKAADFNGSGSIQSSISKTTLANNFSVSFWWKPDLMNTTQVPIGGLYDETGGLAYGWMVYQGSDNKMYLYWIISASPNLSNSISNDVVLEKGKWYHVVVTKTSSSASIYVDKSSASSSPSQGNIFNIVYNTNPSFIIGNQNVSSYYANGIINQIRVFTSALSASQVTELYNETAADNSVLNYPNGTGCIAAYPLGENANGVDGLYNGSSSNVTFGKPGYLTRNTEGTIESTVSANNDLGFSIVSYTGNGSAGATVGHGIDTPELVIVKRLSGVENWAVYSAYSHPTVPQNYLLTLDNTSAAGLNSTRWNNTAPTNAVFSVGTSQAVNASANTYIAYCFASKPNYSKVGSYLGNGNTTGPVIDLGFEPAWLMFKCVTQSGNWIIIDNKRATSNPRTPHLRANSSAQDDTGANEYVDFTSNGFQPKGVSNYNNNSSNQTYIYLAFANTI